MKFPHPPVWIRRILGSALVAMLLSGPLLQAWPWRSEPQPLLHRDEAIRADAGSPLAWDRSARVLWSIAGGMLQQAYWTGSTFQRRSFLRIYPDSSAGLMADAGWHIVYYLDDTGRLCLVRRTLEDSPGERIGDERLGKLLAVDARGHSLYAYDPQAEGIRRYTYDAKGMTWSSVVIASGLGAAGDAAAFDVTGNVIYSSHETANASVPRHPHAQTIGDPTGIGAWKPWPLVATRWDGRQWSSQVIDETGVPQQPAVRAADHMLFYARRDDGDLVRTFQPARGGKEEVFGVRAGWSGTDTFEDNDSYTIRAPQYPPEWLGWSLSLRTESSVFTGVIVSNVAPSQGPITIVPYYSPVWTDTAMPPHLTHFRAVVSARENRLVLHGERSQGEVLRQQTGMTLAGYLYRDATGVLAKSGYSFDSSGSNHLYPALGPDYDPTNPPADFATLADPLVRFNVRTEDIIANRPPGYAVLAGSIPAHYSIDASAPFVPAHLRLPTAVDLRTFGHSYFANQPGQRGTRFQHYRNFGTGYALPSALAVDPATGVTFYTQAPLPADNQDAVPYEDYQYTNPPLAGFRPAPDPKLSRPANTVWIVMVYDAAAP